MTLQTKRWLLVAAFPFLLSLTAVFPVRAADAVAVLERVQQHI